MTRIISIILLFIVSSLVQMSLINTLALPFSLFPLQFILGVIILHRAGIELGAFWFIGSSLILPLLGFDQAFFWSYWTVAVVGAILTKRIFTTRSVYALFGLGFSLFILFNLINWLPSELGAFLFPTIDIKNGFENLTLGQILISYCFLLVGLYFGFVTARTIERIVKSAFLIKQQV